MCVSVMRGREWAASGVAKTCICETPKIQSHIPDGENAYISDIWSMFSHVNETK